MSFSKFLKNPFKYIVLVTQLVSAVEAMYENVSSLDDDPEVQALWQSLKTNPVLASRAAVLRVQVTTIIDFVKQIKK